MKRTGFRVVLVMGLMVIAAGMLSCKEKSSDPPDPPPGPTEVGKAQVWLTTGDRSKLFSREADVSIKDSNITLFPVLAIDTSETFQEIEGFGAALTGSSAYLLHREMTSERRAEILNSLFDPETGIGLSYLRLSMGASDFSLSDFTYNDLPAGQTDFSLEQFSLAQDLEDVVPVLQEILQINPDLNLMGSPWSPPAWMKTNQSLKGGRLKPECYDVYARYFVRYIREMESRGVNITSVTPQNEPLHYTAGYPCMEMQAEQQAGFIRDHLGPAFASEGISTKIIVYDHNWDRPDYPIDILNDPQARQYVAGSAFHAYAGNVTAMSGVHSAHPDKGLYFTEISGGGWAMNFSDNLMWYLRNILIGTVQNWSATALFWNLCLDQNFSPQNNGCTNCRGVITWNTIGGTLTRNEEYYALAHFAKLVRPGALRLGYQKPAELANVGISAFRNTDGTKVMVAANYSDNEVIFCTQQGGRYFTCLLPGKSVATYSW